MRKLFLSGIAVIALAGCVPSAGVMVNINTPPVNQSPAPVNQSAGATSTPGMSCTNSCGNNVCDAIVCQGPNCPCAETATSCPSDCKAPAPDKLCVDQCGNGVCEEIVCLGTGCPCGESATSCAKDCSAAR